MSIDQLKTMNLVTFCESCYGMQFQRNGHVFVCLSPFNQEKNPSFVIHQKNGHWLFKDFSSGKGGSIIDLVRDLENLPNDCPGIVERIKMLLGDHPEAAGSTPIWAPVGGSTSTTGHTDLNYLFKKIQSNPLEPSQRYLESRGISEQVIGNLMKRQQVFTNIFNSKNYCCFVVRNINAELVCLDNHQIDGPSKFVLGTKHIFVPDYDELLRAKEVVITEGIIDLLSMRTLFSATGLALLGNALDFPAEWLEVSQKLILALDNDDAGDLGKEKLRARFPDKEFEDFTVGDYKDPNEVLMAFPEITTKRKKYSSKEKLQIYKEYQRCQNKSAVARQFGIDRSYLNEIINECDNVLLTHFDQKKPGRKKVDEPRDLVEALKQIETLKSQNLELAREKEALYITNEFNQLKINWAEQAGISVKNRHLKKKEKVEAMATMEQLLQQTKFINKGEIIHLSGILTSRTYVWQQGIDDRKKRASQVYEEEVDAAIKNIISYPHMGGKKGAMMLAYHQIEYIGQRCYDFVKKQLLEVIVTEIKLRRLEGKKVKWQKPAAHSFGEIWCADFTYVVLYGQVIFIAVVLDDYSHYYLGYSVSAIADIELVDRAFTMALETCNGVLPQLCMVNDRGSQYKAELYREHIKSYEIKQVFIPPGTPWNNGEAEVGMKDIKALIYQCLAHAPRKRGQDIVEMANIMAKEIFKELNNMIPRPKLQGVTPVDVAYERAEEKRTSIQNFINKKKAERVTKKRIDNVKQYIIEKIELDKWSDRHLKNFIHLINHKYNLIVPEKV